MLLTGPVPGFNSDPVVLWDRTPKKDTSNVYYTTKIKDERGGAVKFEDKKTQTSVTLQDSEVKKISKKEFKSALKAKDAKE